MSLSNQVKKRIIRNLINGQDYRSDVVLLIDDIFLNYCIDFFKRVIEAKIKNENITTNWYKKEFLNPNLPKQDIAINAINDYNETIISA